MDGQLDLVERATSALSTRLGGVCGQGAENAASEVSAMLEASDAHYVAGNCSEKDIGVNKSLAVFTEVCKLAWVNMVDGCDTCFGQVRCSFSVIL